MNIYTKLLKVQTELKAPKNKYNKFGDYSYRNCESILEAAKPLLLEVGAIVLLSDKVEEIAGRWYIVASAAFIDASTGERVEVEACARETATRPKFDDAQITGAASSYARKYALGGLFGVDDGDDVDALPDAGSDGRGAGKSTKKKKAPASRPSASSAPGASYQNEDSMSWSWEQQEVRERQQQKSSAGAADQKQTAGGRPSPAPRPTKKADGAPELINAVQQQLLLKEMEKIGVKQDSILQRFNITDIMQLSEKDYRALMREWQRKSKEGSASAGGSGAGE